MSKILVVGLSQSEARAVAHEVAESRGETMKMITDSTYLESDKHEYHVARVSEVLDGKLRGERYDEVHVIGSVSAQSLKQIEAVVFAEAGAKPKVEVFVQDETNTHFFAKGK